jgi:hypothetical protein
MILVVTELQQQMPAGVPLQDHFSLLNLAQPQQQLSLHPQ